MSSAISVENLGKKYLLSHQASPKPYVALRDVLSDGVKNLGRTLLGRGPASGDPHQEEFWALKDVSFEVKQGDRIGIIGRNGAGKSTLLKILSRITEPTTGSVRVRGRVASLLEVGTGFHPELTGRENIFLNGAILGMGRGEIRKKFAEIVDFAEIDKFLDTPVKRYSSGMYVRLAFAVAAHLEPEILVVDEVLAVGDSQFQKKCLGKMGEVSKEGRTVLFVSHNIHAIVSLCTRGLLLQDGSLHYDGMIDEAVLRYASKLSELNGTFRAASIKRGGGYKLRIDVIQLLKDGNVSTSYQSYETLTVRIHYTVTCPLQGPQLCVELATDRDEVVFATTNQDLTCVKSAVCPGQYIIECPIKLGILREGRYFIKVSSSIPGVEVLDSDPEPLFFVLHNESSPIIRLAQGRRGVILPIIEWKQIV